MPVFCYLSGIYLFSRVQSLLALVMSFKHLRDMDLFTNMADVFENQTDEQNRIVFLTSWKPKLSDSQFCAIICSFIRRHNVKLKYYAVIFIKLHQNQSGRQGISTSKDKSSQKLRFFEKASFLNYRLYRSYLTNCALLDIVVITH